MLKMRFTRATARILILIKLVLLLVIFYAVANFIKLKTFVTFSKKVNFHLRHEPNIMANPSQTNQPTLNFTKQFTSYKFKPALERPKFYTTDGLGEFGVKVVLENLTKEEKSQESQLLQEYGINQFLSENISLHRTLKDARPPG